MSNNLLQCVDPKGTKKSEKIHIINVEDGCFWGIHNTYL